MQAIAEGALLGERLGLDRERMLEVLAKTPVVAPAHQGKLLRAAREDYSPQFPTRLMQKDFGLILQEAERLRIRMPATLRASRVNEGCVDCGDYDFSYVMERMRSGADSELSNPRW